MVLRVESLTAYLEALVSPSSHNKKIKAEGVFTVHIYNSLFNIIL
jgi:hypothetical protein